MYFTTIFLKDSPLLFLPLCSPSSCSCRGAPEGFAGADRLQEETGARVSRSEGHLTISRLPWVIFSLTLLSFFILRRATSHSLPFLSSLPHFSSVCACLSPPLPLFCLSLFPWLSKSSSSISCLYNYTWISYWNDNAAQANDRFLY